MCPGRYTCSVKQPRHRAGEATADVHLCVSALNHQEARCFITQQTTDMTQRKQRSRSPASAYVGCFTCSELFYFLFFHMLCVVGGQISEKIHLIVGRLWCFVAKVALLLTLSCQCGPHERNSADQCSNIAPVSQSHRCSLTSFILG